MTLTAADRLDLTELVARLCQALDFSRPKDFVDVFTADGVYQATSSVETGEQSRFRHAGAAELLAFAESASARRKGLGRHWTGNIVFSDTDEGAAAITYGR